MVNENGETAVGYAVVKFTKNNEKYNATIVMAIGKGILSEEEIARLIQTYSEFLG